MPGIKNYSRFGFSSYGEDVHNILGDHLVDSSELFFPTNPALKRIKDFQVKHMGIITPADEEFFYRNLNRIVDIVWKHFQDKKNKVHGGNGVVSPVIPVQTSALPGAAVLPAAEKQGIK